MRPDGVEPEAGPIQQLPDPRQLRLVVVARPLDLARQETCAAAQRECHQQREPFPPMHRRPHANLSTSIIVPPTIPQERTLCAMLLPDMRKSIAHRVRCYKAMLQFAPLNNSHTMSAPSTPPTNASSIVSSITDTTTGTLRR
jgi:hypothetical protein